MGGPNWFSANGKDFEKVSIKKLYNPSRQVKLAVTYDIGQTVAAIIK